jgi:hypothetical protein
LKQTTDVKRIADAFRRANKITPDKQITVNYDGLDLSMDTLVENTEIIELEPGEHALLEVHIK